MLQQSYPVNLALSVSSIILLLISRRIILAKENRGVGEPFYPETKSFTLRDSRWLRGTPTGHVIFDSFRMHQSPDRERLVAARI